MSRFEERPKREIKQVKQDGAGKNVFFDNPNVRSHTADPDSILRQTFYITEQQRIAISLMSAHEDIDKSEIVRNALESYIPKKYLQMALFT